jgi:D-arabinose 1-dehydrogenase-like Zn-dependent alcohol dehydrogenase
MSATYRAIEVAQPGKFSEVRRPLKDPGPGQLRIGVEACGVCHSSLSALYCGKKCRTADLVRLLIHVTGR